MAASDVIFDKTLAKDYRILRVESGMKKKMLKHIDDASKEILDKLISVDPVSYTRLSTRLSKVKDFDKGVKKILQEFTPIIHKDLMNDLRELSIYAVDATIKDWNDVLGGDIASSTLTKTQKASLATNTFVQGEQMQKLVKGLTNNLQDAVGNAVRQSVLNGESMSTMVRKIRGTRENSFKDGILNTSTNSARRIVRTSVNATMNTARQNTIEENKDVIGMVQWVSTLDTRTSELCAARDGLSWSLPDYEPIDHNIPWQSPPIHPNCRSTIIGIPRPVKDIPKGKQKQIPEKNRASIDGVVSQSTNFEQWLKKQPIEKQRKVLGATKHKLFSEGKITLQDLLNQDGNVMTVSDLLKTL